MTKENGKQILISILVGACVAFLTTLVDGLAEFLKSHATEITAGASTTFYHIAKTFRA